MPVSQTQIILDQIKELGARLDDGFKSLDERLRALEIKDGKDHKAVDMNIDAAWTKIDAHAARLDKIEKDLENALETVRWLNSVAKWLLGIFTAILTSFLILLLSGKINILIK